MWQLERIHTMPYHDACVVMLTERSTNHRNQSGLALRTPPRCPWRGYSAVQPPLLHPASNTPDGLSLTAENLPVCLRSAR